MKILKLALMSSLVACGAQSENTESASATKLINGTDWHHASGSDINVRDHSLRRVVCTLDRGDRFQPTGNSKVGTVGGTSYRFHQAYVPKCGVEGWIADGTWVQPGSGGHNPGRRFVDIWHTSTHDTFFISSPDGSLNCNPGPFISRNPVTTFYNGDYIWSNGRIETGPNGKPWIEINMGGHASICYVRGNTKYLTRENH